MEIYKDSFAELDEFDFENIILSNEIKGHKNLLYTIF